MSPRTCPHCGAPVGPGGTVCAECGARHPAGLLRWASLGVAVLFALAVLAGVFRFLDRPDLLEVPAPPPELAVVDNWSIGLFGVGQSVVLPREQVSEEGMARVRRLIREGTEGRSFVRVYLFTDPDAARLRESGLARELGERQEWFERRFVGVYARNDRLGEEELAFAPGGYRLEEPRTVTW